MKIKFCVGLCGEGWYVSDTLEGPFICPFCREKELQMEEELPDIEE